jgi:hypothetical protein
MAKIGADVPVRHVKGGCVCVQALAWNKQLTHAEVGAAPVATVPGEKVAAGQPEAPDQHVKKSIVSVLLPREAHRGHTHQVIEV